MHLCGDSRCQQQRSGMVSPGFNSKSRCFLRKMEINSLTCFLRILMNCVLLHKCFRARNHFLSFLLPNSKSLLSRAVTITKRRTFNLSKILKHYTSLWHSLARYLALDSRRIQITLSRLASSSFLFSIAIQYAWQFKGLQAQQIHWNSMACPMAKLVKTL